MLSVNSTDIKNHFGEYLDRSREAPIQITKNGRPSAVLLSWKDYETLEALQIFQINTENSRKKDIKIFLGKLRGSAKTAMTTEEIMKLTRDDD